MANDVTTGQELNSYKGDAALGTGEAYGYAPINLAPLEQYALHKFEINKINYEQQQKDKRDLHDEFTDPNLYLFLDEPFANQVNPKLDELKELSKKNLQMDPNGKDWYRFHELYNEILKDNAGLKTVQTLKDKTKKSIEATADVHEKERLEGYVKQLDQYKLGQEIPVYNSYFGPDLKHLPDLKEETGTYLKLGGSKAFPTEQKIKYTIYNPIDAFELARKKVVEQPDALQTGGDFSHTFLEMGGIDEANNAAKDIYKKALSLNIGQLQSKYSDDYKKYESQNPGASFRDYMNNTGKDSELQSIYDKLSPLNDGLSVVPISADNGVELKGFTYYTDPKSGAKVRMNLSDADMLGFMAATKKPIGKKEEVVEEKFAKDVVAADQAKRDDATKRRGQTLDYNAAMAKIKADKDHWSSTQKGGETVKNSALERAKRIYGDILKLADENGFISPQKIRQLNTEQLKYLGTDLTTTSENGVAKTTFTPLSLPSVDKEGNAIEYGIQIKDGEIKVMAPEPGKNKLGIYNGGYTGYFDNSKSSNIFNIATNVLNEELQKAGSKELNSYMAIDNGDLKKTTTENNIGGSSSQSASFSSSSSFSIKGKPYTKTKLNEMGYTDEQIQQAIKLGNINVK
jgi:hypothetical protein